MSGWLMSYRYDGALTPNSPGYYRLFVELSLLTGDTAQGVTPQ
jgi:hypothetical protein